MAVTEKALSEAPGSAGALVKPQYGVGDKCPECGTALKRLPSGAIGCPNCGYGDKKAVAAHWDAVPGKTVPPWDIKQQRDGTLVIEGYASTWMEDRDGDTVDRRAFDESLPDYLADNPVLLLDHDRTKVLGAITEAETDNIGLRIKAQIPKPEPEEEGWRHTAYHAIRKGLRRALSIGGVFHRGQGEKSARKHIHKVSLFEISNIAVPSNPKSLFRVTEEKGLSFGDYKADGEGDPNSMVDNAANRRAWARAGYALPDGSFPVLKCGTGFGSVSAAISSIGRGGASTGRIKAHIIKNVERLKCTDELPEDWGGKAAPFAEWKATDEPDPESMEVSHTHAKVGGGKVTHAHDGAKAGHDHPGLLPMVAGAKAADDCGCEVTLDEMEKAAADFINKAQGNEQALLDYWTEQMGGGEGEAGDFDACVEALSKHDDIDDPKALCAWIHMQVTGASPGHAAGEEDDGKAASLPDDAEASGPPRLHIHVPTGGKTIGRHSMVHSHPLPDGLARHRHEGFRAFKHPTQKEVSQMGQETKGATATETKGTEGGSEKKTVTLSEEEFKAWKEERDQLLAEKKAKEEEALAEEMAEKRLQTELETKRAAEEDERKTADRIATMVEQRLEAKRAATFTGRKYIGPGNGGSIIEVGPKGKKEPGMISLLYRKSQGDPDAREKLIEMSQKAAQEMEWEGKALAEGGGATGGFLVPPQYMQQGIAEFRIAAARVRQLCSVFAGINSNLVYIPRETGIATVGWTAEGAAKSTADQTFGQLAVNIFTLAGISKVNNQLLEDSSPAVENIVRRDLGRLLGQAEDIAFLVGTGSGQPTGILNTAGILTGAIGGATLADAIATAIAGVQSNYFGDPEAILMHPKHLNVLRTLKDVNNRYIFEPSFFAGADPRMRAFNDNPTTLGGGFTNMPTQGGPQGSVWGLPVFSDANLPTPANAGNAIVGAFSEAYVLERAGVTVDASSEAGTSFEQNQTWFRGEERLGFTAARQPTAFYAITGLA